MFSAIIVAGGASSRMGGTDKQLSEIGGVPVFVMSALRFQQCELVSEIIIAAPDGRTALFTELAQRHGVSKLKAVVSGGATRFLSVKNALAEISGGIGYIAIHDGARPLISPEDIERVLRDALEYGAAIAAAPAADTVKISGGGFVEDTPQRDVLYYAQTPQAFRKADYLKWVSRLGGQAETLTDDSRLAELCGAKVRITEITRCNMKITRREDLAAARAVAAVTEGDTMRIGQGYDVHRLCEGRRLVLCGVEIPSPEGLLGHSDADVAVHALMDAILGALALGDIGKLFPDSDMKYKDADSMVLLSEVISLMKKGGYTLGNLDITIIAERPKLAGYIPAMRESLAAAFGCGIGRVGVKATTEEGLGLAGEGIGAHAAVLLVRM